MYNYNVLCSSSTLNAYPLMWENIWGPAKNKKITYFTYLFKEEMSAAKQFTMK